MKYICSIQPSCGWRSFRDLLIHSPGLTPSLVLYSCRVSKHHTSPAESLSTIRLKRDIYLAYSLLSSFQEFVIWGRIHTCSKTFSSFVSWKRLVPPGKRPAFFFFKHLNLKSKKSAVSSGDLRADVRAQLQRPAHLSAWEHLFLPQPFGGGLCFGFLIMCLA